MDFGIPIWEATAEYWRSFGFLASSDFDSAMESAGGPKKCGRNSNAKDMFGREGGVRHCRKYGDKYMIHLDRT